MSYVYLMRSGDRFKIGRARDVGRRWRTFRTADPDIRTEHVIPTGQANRLESELHRCFDRKHIDLEWFRLSPGDVTFIKSLGGNAGQWLRHERQRRRRLRQIAHLVRRLARAVVTAILYAIAVYLIWRFAQWVSPELHRLLPGLKNIFPEHGF